MTTLGVIHRIEDLQVVCFAVVFGIMALQSRRDRTFQYLLLSYLLGSAVSVIDVSVAAPMPAALSFTNLALISLRYGAMTFALAEFLKARAWFARVSLMLSALPLAAVFVTAHSGASSRLPAVDYATLGAQFLLLVAMLFSRREKATRTPRQLLAVLFLLSVLIRCVQMIAVLRPTPGIVWLRDQLWFFNSTLVGCMVPFAIIWMMNARVYSDLRKLSLMDPLTGLLNRRGLQQAVTREMARYSRNRQNLGVAVADIDHFKKLNDTHGHTSGDTVLQTFAEICKDTLRQTDIIARTGGEEFTMILPIASNAEMHAVMDRVRETLATADLSSRAGPGVRSTVSIGVTSTASRTDVTWETLLHEADTALYEAKRSGRNRTLINAAISGPADGPDLLDVTLPIA